MIRSGGAPGIGWSRNMLYSGLITLHRSVVRRQTGFAARITRTLCRFPSAPMAFCRNGNFAYNLNMIKAYNEIVEFIASGTTPQSVAAFTASPETKEHVADLLMREKSDGLTAEEVSELDHFMKIEHLMRLAKARAQKIVAE